MKSTQKERERLHKEWGKLDKEEKSKPKKKPKPIKVYSKGYVQHEIKSLEYKPEKGYQSVGQLIVENENSANILVSDYMSKKDIGYIKDKRLIETLKNYSGYLCQILVAEEHKSDCRCHECYNDIETYSITANIYVRVNEEEATKIQELSDTNKHKTRRKLNAYLREVGLYNEAK
ncbi:MAG: hypothetical protein HN522_03475 [Flavobacteriales bacterium]|nr:hypothetical protein [Flavobacteriales bacterium]